MVLKQFRALDNLLHLSVLQNLGKILIDSKSEEYPYSWIFALGIVYGSLVKIKCLYSRVHFIKVCGYCLHASVFPPIFSTLYYPEVVILIKESEINVTYLIII